MTIRPLCSFVSDRAFKPECLGIQELYETLEGTFASLIPHSGSDCAKNKIAEEITGLS